MNKGVRFRIYPNKQQRELLAQTFGCVRLIYNLGLSMRKEAYDRGEKAGYSQTSAMLTELKEQDDHAFLRDVDSIALQQSLRSLDAAFNNYFSGRAGYPVYKSKHDHFRSYRTINQNGSVRFAGNYIRLPKLGYVKVKQTMDVGHINHATIEQTPSGKYYVVLNVEFEPEPLPETDKAVGLDVGIKDFCTLDDGTVVPNPKYLEQAQKKLAKEQRKHSRMEEGSNNWNKQRIRVARAYEHVTNQRNDFLQKLSTALMIENQVICVEDLQVKNMLKNHKLARAISSVSWSKFFTMLEYKARWYGRTVVRVPTFYPSSQTCSECGYKNRDVKDLSIRKWICPQCGMVHNRDGNAATNILAKGLSMINDAA